MPHPQLVLDALPTASGIPQSVIDSYTPAGNRPTRIDNALPGVAAPAFATVLRPVTDYWEGGWGCNDPDFSIATHDADALFVQSSATTGNVGVSIGMEEPTPLLTPDTDWVFHCIARKHRYGPNLDFPIIGCDLFIGTRPTFTPNPGWTGAGGTGGVYSGVSGGEVTRYFFGSSGTGQTLTLAYQDFTYAITQAEMAAIIANLVNPTRYLIVQFITRTNNGDPGSGNNFIEVDEVWLEYTGPGAGGGAGGTPNIIHALPQTADKRPLFFRNSLPT